MIKLNFMDKLLDGVEFEWKAIWEVTTWDKKFNAVSREKQPKVISYPYLLAADLFKLEQDGGDVFLLSTGERTGWTTEELAGEYIREGEVVTIPWGKSRPLEGVLKYYKGRFVTADNRIATSNNTDKLLNKFLYYWLLNQSMVIDGFYRGSGIQHPNMASVLNMEIPIPPLTVQEEIVRILDAFTELTAELAEDLAAELIARKKQYNYYRDKLLAFEEGEVEWKSLGEVVLPTSNIRWRDTRDTFRYIDLTSVCREKNIIIKTTEISAENAPSRAQKLVIKDDVIFATTRPTQQRLCLITEEFSGEVASTGYCILRAKRNEVLPKWLYYCIASSKFKNYVEENQSGSAYPAISDAKVKEFKVPIPLRTEQERIVSILDKFESLTTSITDGLHCEIELRQKRYEYYRNMLLNFPEKEVEV